MPAHRCSPSRIASLVLTVFAALALATAPPSARAAVIHVPDDYPTIQQGINAAASGDVVMVAAGEYFEQITLKAGVIVQGAGDERSIINGGGDNGDVVSAIGNDIQSSAKLIGFTVTGAISGGGMPGGAGIFCNSGGSPEITNCRFRGNDFGITTWNNASPLVHNNVVVGNNYTGIDISSHPTVINNTIDSNRTGIYDGGGYRPTVMNNIVTRNSVRGIGAVSAAYPPTLSYNDVWGNGQNYYNCTPGTGDISVDPQFRDAGAGDYHLSPGSLCIDAGNPGSQYNDPDGSRNDMGAYGGPGAESDAPAVSLTDPHPNAIQVPVDTDAAAVFTVAMNGSTLSSTTFLLRGEASGFHAGTVTYDEAAHTVMIVPAAAFRAGEKATAILTSGVQSAGGLPLAGGYTWQFTCAAADGSAEFELGTQPAVQPTPFHIAAADFNHDGRLDLACGHGNPLDHVSILMGQGDGTFSSANTFPAGVEPLDPVAGDFDHDGNLDLAVACGQGGAVAVLLGNGDGTFDAPALYGFAVMGTALAAGDVDADGDLDLVVTRSSATCAVLLNDGSGSFTWGWSGTVGAAPSDVKLGDLDGDGRLDLAVACQAGVNVLLGAGDGTFGSPRNFPVGVNTISIDEADLNGDGVLDIAVADASGNRASILTGDGLGGFTGPVNYTTPSGPHDIVAGDFDADGDLDLALSCFGSDTIAILRNLGAGTFAAATSWTSVADPEGIVSGDFDGDGDIDLAVTNANSATVSVVLNKDALGVSALDPAPMTLHVPLAAGLRAVFDGAVDPTTLNSATVHLQGSHSGPHAGTITYDAGSWTLAFDPTRDFVPGELMTAMLTTGIRAQNGVLFRGWSWDFTAAVTRASYGGYGSPSSFNAGNDPRGIQAADFDGDGDIDLAVCSCGNYPAPGSASVLLNHGDGTFASPVLYSLGAPDPIDLFAADLDGDGDIDLAVVHNEPGSSHLEILRNAGNGTFAISATYTPVFLGQCISGGDLDGDGDIDLVLTDGWGSADNVKVLLNAGNGTFPQSRTYSAGIYAHGIAIFDADGDGDRDLAIGNPGSADVSVLYNDGTGAFPWMHNFASASNAGELCANDFNGDGTPDLAAGGANGVVVLLGTGGGGFAPPATTPITASVQRVEWADADGDHDLDLVAACSDNTIRVSLNNGSGVFGLPATYTVGSGPQGIAAADFSGDGTLDLASPIWDGNRVDVLYGYVPAGINDLVNAPARDPYSFPNPFTRGTNIVATSGSLEIHDVTGRLVRTLRPGPEASGRGVFFWDGNDEQGRPVSPGIYFGRPVEGNGRTVRIVRIR